MGIRAKQNERYFLVRFAAARKLYARAKQSQNAYIMLNVVLVTALTFLSILLNSKSVGHHFGFETVDYSKFVAVVSVIVLTLDKFIVNESVEKCKEEAAKIQDQADRALFGFSWNTPLAGSPPSATLISKHGERLLKREGTRPFENWYALRDDSLRHPYQVLICQNACLSWDVSLRSRVNATLVILGVIIFGLALGLSIYLNLSASSVLTNMVALTGPIVDFGYTVYSGNKKTMQNTNRLIDHLTEAVENDDQQDAELTELCEAIQDQIYINRRDSWPIPDILYKWLRDSEETIMVDSAADLESQLVAKQRTQC